MTRATKKTVYVEDARRCDLGKGEGLGNRRCNHPKAPGNLFCTHTLPPSNCPLFWHPVTILLSAKLMKKMNERDGE